VTSIHVVTRKASFWKGASETRQNCFKINIHPANICQNQTGNEDERKVHLSSKSTNHVVSFNLNSDRNIIPNKQPNISSNLNKCIPMWFAALQGGTILFFLKKNAIQIFFNIM